MTDERCEPLILQIRALQDELVTLGVKREYIKFYRLNFEDLETELESVGEQLKARKRFLGVDSYEKSNGAAG